MPKEGSNAFYRAYADRFYLDRANRDTYLARQAVGDLLTSGHIYLPTKLVKDLDAPVADGDAARKKYVDDLVALYLPLAGGTLTGDVTVDALRTIDGVDVSVHAATLNAHLDNPWRVIRTGEYNALGNIISGTSLTMVANTLYAISIIITRDITIDRIALHVETAASGKSVRLGIYRDGTNLYPGVLLLDAGTVSAATTGIKEITISQALTKGIYWLVCLSDGTPVIKGAAVSQVRVLGDVSTDFTLRINGWTVSQTYGALPDPFTAGGTQLNSNAPICYILLRILSLD